MADRRTTQRPTGRARARAESWALDVDALLAENEHVFGIAPRLGGDAR